MTKLFIIALFVLTGCQAKSELARFKSLCESTGGVFLDCEKAFAEGCSRAESIEGKDVICSCRDGKTWDGKRGCR